MTSKFKLLTNHRVAKNSFALILMQLVSMIAPLLALPYLSRILGVDGFGFVMLAFSASAIGIVLTDFGFSLSATYKISQNRANIEYINKFIGAVLSIKVFLALLITVFVLSYDILIGLPTGSSLIAYYVCLNIFFQAFTPLWFFQGIERMKYVTVFMVIAKLSYILMVFIFVNTDKDTALAILLLAISNFIGSIVALSLLYLTGYSIKKPGVSLIYLTFYNSLQFFFSRASVTLYTSASTFLVGAFSGVQQAAIYGASEKFYQAFQSLTGPISQALYPYMAKENNEKLLVKLVIILGIPLLIMCVFSWMWSFELIELIFGEDFYDAGNILRVFLIIVLINFISVNFGYPAFAGINKVYIANYTVIVGALAQFCFLCVLYYLEAISAISVVFSVLITELIVVVLRVGLYFRCKSK